VTPVSIGRRGEPSVRLHPADNVVVAARALAAGTTLDGVVLRGDVPSGHKVAVAPIAEGEPVRKYNQIIGFATGAIAPGDHVHTHNTAFQTFERD
jgi:altronate hydrolase